MSDLFAANLACGRGESATGEWTAGDSVVAIGRLQQAALGLSCVCRAAERPRALPDVRL